MSLLIVVGALALLMLAAYRGYSVILFAPVAAMAAVLLTDPANVAPAFTGLFMERMVGFLKLYFPVFMLGAVFGKLIEMSGFSQSIAAAVTRLLGDGRAVLSVVIVCALLTYGGVSLFVVVFAVYPCAAELFRRANIPKRLMPGTIALGALTFTMDSLPGTPQIQNIIPTTFFGTSSWAAPVLGTIGSAAILIAGLSYLHWRCAQAVRSGEGYGREHANEPARPTGGAPVHPLKAIAPLVLVVVVNLTLARWLTSHVGPEITLSLIGLNQPVVLQLASVSAIWAVIGALLAGILFTVGSAFGRIAPTLIEGTRVAIAGALLSAMSVASEFGFGAVVAALPGFLAIKGALRFIPNPLVNEALTITTLAGITGSASGGLSIALAAFSGQFLAVAQRAGIPAEVLHRIAAMASGGMDTLPHNGSVITILAVTGLTHRQAYKDIFAITCVKTAAVFIVIAVYYSTGLV